MFTEPIPNELCRNLSSLFPTLSFTEIACPNMGRNSTFFEGDPQHENLELAAKRLEQFQQKHPNALLANGYLEQRSFYNTKNYERHNATGIEYRNIHLGTDFWVPAGTPLHCLYESTVVISEKNNYHKDYGGLLVLKHQIQDLAFYTLYGHLSLNSVDSNPVGKEIGQDELFAFIGNETENGHWLPHLHFQVITDLLGNTKNFNGVAFPSEIEYWKQLCPNPSWFFHESF